MNLDLCLIEDFSSHLPQQVPGKFLGLEKENSKENHSLGSVQLCSENRSSYHSGYFPLNFSRTPLSNFDFPQNTFIGEEQEVMQQIYWKALTSRPAWIAHDSTNLDFSDLLYHFRFSD